MRGICCKRGIIAIVDQAGYICNLKSYLQDNLFLSSTVGVFVPGLTAVWNPLCKEFKAYISPLVLCQVGI